MPIFNVKIFSIHLIPNKHSFLNLGQIYLKKWVEKICEVENGSFYPPNSTINDDNRNVAKN